MVCPYCHRNIEEADVCPKCYAVLPKFKKETKDEKDKKEVKEEE